MMLEVVTPYQHFFEGKVESIVLAALDGELGILPGHAPVVVALAPGIAHVVIDGKKRYAMISEGYAEVGPYMTIIVCNAAEWAEDIDVKRAYAAFQRASLRYREAPMSSMEKVYARHSIRRAKMRLKIVNDHGTEEQKKLLNELQSSEG